MTDADLPQVARPVRCHDRWIDYDEALPRMDEELLRSANASVEEYEFFMRRADANLYRKLTERGGVEAELSAALQALPDLHAERRPARILETYLRLHLAQYGAQFDPGLPEVAPAPPVAAVQLAFQQLWELFRTRLPGIRISSQPQT